ncbi:hypothetical protein EIP86_007682 [Pleurotus ostreatoroseus]|nr:hypothetical protein EIP86_007682 [Pleurotus ostreatoroseus]
MSQTTSKKRKREDRSSFWTIRDPAAAQRNLTVTHVDTLSADGRRISRTSHKTYTRIPDPPQAREAHSACADHHQDLQNEPSACVPPIVEVHNIQPKRGRRNPAFATLTHDPALQRWAEKHRSLFLEELLRLEGLRGSTENQCSLCRSSCGDGMFVCSDCFGGCYKFMCRSCCLDAHRANPFHRIKKWNGSYQESVTLHSIGLVVQLGHPIGECCAAPVPAPRNFTVLHTNGIHPLTLQFCGCSRAHSAGSRTQQLLRYELYGATTTDPSTCCTLRLLEHFHMLTLQSKINAYDYYLSLEKLTDNTGRIKRVQRLKTFLRMVREYRHLKMLKRAGRGQEAGGIAATKPGELCVQCPACPKPGYNLPDNWESVSDDLKFIYTMFIAIDANFRLKRRAISNEVRDPALGSGLAYFVEDHAYREHLAKYVDQEEISTCTGLAALLHANTRWSKGYAATGVGMACCARHGFILPNGVGDLQKGERYCNMDYIFLSALSHVGRRLRKVASYDITCQWIVHLLECMREFPAHLHIHVPDGEIRYVIPKYHFRAHREENHNKFSLNLLPGVGRTDGEEIERNWSRHDGTAGSTREMGPGSRHDTLEDHFGFANWQKFVKIGESLHKRLVIVRPEREKYARLLEEFTREIAKTDTDTWTAQVLAWEKDPKKSDPYYIVPSGMTEAQIRLQLAEEDEQDAVEGIITLHNVSPASMIMELLDIEEKQRRFCAKYPRTASGTPQQTATIVEKRTTLRRRLLKAREAQAVYMPCAPALVAKHAQSLRQKGKEAVVDLVEEQPLFLPCHLDVADLDACEPGLADIELRLREGQLRDALDKLRIHLHIKTRLVTFKNTNVRHQGANTRAQSKIQANEAKIRDYAEKYRKARQMKLLLAGPGDWEQEWRELRVEDVRCMQEVEIDPRTHEAVTEGRRKVSWIWMAAGREGEESAELPGITDALRVEWLRARSRAERFKEEELFLREEQRRVLVSLEQNALVWDRRQGLCIAKASDAAMQGAASYAAEQASLQRAIAARFKMIWAEAVQDDEEAAEVVTHATKVTQDDTEEASNNEGELEYLFSEDEDDQSEGGFGGGGDGDDDDDDGEL